MRQRVHPDGAVFKIVRVIRHLARKRRHIACGGELPLRRKAGAILIGRIVHAQLRCARVHPIDEIFLRPGDVLGQRHGGIIRAGDNRRAQQIFQLILASRVEQRLRTAHARRVLGAGHAVAQPHRAVL